jgi:tRNA pseudouridine32 synthase/23S rRNA pseudouridine746 synthase
MMKGLEKEESNHLTEEVEILYEDEAVVAAEKPSGTPSVPGLDGRTSIFESLKEKYLDLYTVHRLDMDTSGVILFAKTSEAAVNLQKQFENHTIRKTYHARLSASAEGRIGQTDFADEVSVEFAVPKENWDQFCKKIEEAFSARMKISKICEKYC